MTLKEIAYVTGTKLQVKKTCEGFCAEFYLAEIKGCGILRSASSFGKTKDIALLNLTKEVQGRTLVMNAYTPNRKEINIPSKVTVK